jgi:hypothetical protein
MKLLTLTVFQLEGITPEKAVEIVKKGAASYLSLDLQEVVYLTNDASPEELLILTSWGSQDAVKRAAGLWKERLTALQNVGLRPDLQRTTVFRVVKEFQRYHLTPQAATISLGRIANPELSMEQALDFLKKSAKEYLISWPDLVRHRLAHTTDGSNIILFHNDWVSTEGWQAYRTKYNELYQVAVAKVGLEYLFTASKLLDTFKVEVTVSKPTALKSKPQ